MNHVAFGVEDMARTRAFYERLGFTEMLFESVDFFEPMAPWYPYGPPDQHMIMLLVGAGRRASSRSCSTPKGPDCRGEWGHIGPFDFAVGVTSLERGLDALRRMGVETGEPVTLDVGEGRVALRVVPRPRRSPRDAGRGAVLISASSLGACPPVPAGRAFPDLSDGPSDGAPSDGSPLPPRR